jgi:hypothetical protein
VIDLGEKTKIPSYENDVLAGIEPPEAHDSQRPNGRRKSDDFLEQFYSLAG